MRNRLLRLFAYAAVGVATGLVVAGFEMLTVSVLLDRLLERDVWQQALAPGAGLVCATLLLRWADRGDPLSPATSEEYIRAYHERRPVVRLLQLPFRLLAGVATVGLGGAVGLEGPSVYSGATIGSAIQHRLDWLFREKDAKALLVAGAAAGVSAIFQAPATGVLFALESPYKGDLGRRALLPSLIASAISYVTFVLVTGLGGERPFDVNIARTTGSVGYGYRELVGAAVVGLACGAGAVLFSRTLKRVKQEQSERVWWHRLIASSVVLGGLVVLTDQLYHEPLSLGPTAGHFLVDWVVDAERSLWLVGLLLVIRFVAMNATLLGGGVGGVFIPLAVSGLIVGRLVGGWVDVDNETLTFFPFIGVAAFLAGGYRTPLAAVMFVAESTGAPEFVVPGLIAVAVSQVVIGNTSVSSYQRDTRTGHLERRFQMPITAAMHRELHLMRPDDSIGDFVWGHAFAKKELAAVVADDDGHFRGVVRLHDATEVERSEWGETTLEQVMIDDVDAARLSWTIREVSSSMDRYGLEQFPVVDPNGRVVGVVTSDAILKLDEILGETRGS